MPRTRSARFWRIWTSATSSDLRRFCVLRICGSAATRRLLGLRPAVELAVERLPIEPQDPGREGLVSARCFEDLHDVALLDLFERHELGGIVASDEHVGRAVAPHLLGE